MADWFKRIWARYWMRKSKFSGRYDDLQKLYALKDPWNLQSAKERQRFEATNDMIRALAPDCRCLLELGCGEGIQTEYLMQVSDRVAGIDVSALAVKRAEVRCPGVELRVGRAEEVSELFPGRRFDLVTAFEVLYYSDDIPRVITQLQELSDRILVTNYAERAERMREHFEAPGWRRLADINAEGTTWECRAWVRPA